MTFRLPQKGNSPTFHQLRHMSSILPFSSFGTGKLQVSLGRWVVAEFNSLRSLLSYVFLMVREEDLEELNKNQN